MTDNRKRIRRKAAPATPNPVATDPARAPAFTDDERRKIAENPLIALGRVHRAFLASDSSAAARVTLALHEILRTGDDGALAKLEAVARAYLRGSVTYKQDGDWRRGSDPITDRIDFARHLRAAISDALTTKLKRQLEDVAEVKLAAVQRLASLIEPMLVVASPQLFGCNETPDELFGLICTAISRATIRKYDEDSITRAVLRAYGLTTSEAANALRKAADSDPL